MAEPGRNNIKLVPFLTYTLIAVLLILNMAWGDITRPPRMPDWAGLKDTLVYSITFASALIQGREMAANHLLTGILLVVLIPWAVLALIFRRNILRIFLSITIYALVLAGISWILALVKIQPPIPSGDRAIKSMGVLLNIPFGYIFYVGFLLIGHSLMALPLFLLGGAFTRRYWKGKKAWRVFRITVWGYLELLLVMALVSQYNQALSGGVLLDSLTRYLDQMGGRWILITLVSLTMAGWLFFILKPLFKKGKSGSKSPKSEKGTNVENAQAELGSSGTGLKLDFHCPKLPEGTETQEIEGTSTEAHPPVEDSAFIADAKSFLEEVLRELEIPLLFEKITQGPRFQLFLFGLPKGGSLKTVKAKEEDLRFRLQEKNIQPLIPVPGIPRIGFLLERKNPETVDFKAHAAELQQQDQTLPILLGKSLTGELKFTDLTSHPHLLLAGSTGSGKSIFLHVLINSLMEGPNRQQLKLVLMDPKRVEFSSYKGSPHLACPILEEPAQIQEALFQLEEQMEKRYQILESQSCRDIGQYNEKFQGKMPYVVCVLDEAADVLLQDNGALNRHVILLAQKARAVGIHLVLATQRPSADVVNGLIKANFPVRLAFKTASAVDSRVILDENGAESLLGKGDGLFKDQGETLRFQGAMI